MRIYAAKVNHLTNPLGFYLPRTVFSWKVKGAEGKKQKWARIRVAQDPRMKQLLYDSGEDERADSQGTRAVLALSPRTRYYWTAEVCSDADEIAQSEVQWFETAKCGEAWQARWITCDSRQTRHPLFSKYIAPAAGKKVLRARLYICGLGLYEAFYNGVRIGEEYLTPYCNDYNAWVQYQTYDVTQALQHPGQLTVHLGNGWYKGRFGYWSQGEETGYYGSEWKLIAELVLDYDDGSCEVIGTDETWDVARSRITFSNLYDGEHRDDTLGEAPAEKAALCEPPAGGLTARLSLPVMVRERIRAVRLLRTPAGEDVFDLGQEITGIFRLRVHEPAGTRIHIQTGEILQNGNFYNANLRSAGSEYIYISDGSEQIIEPHFTCYGYRYVKVEGIPHPKADDLEGIALCSRMDRTGYVETGYAPVNQLIENVHRGMVDNFLDVPTECPQRDERMGWTGDAQIFAPTAMYLYDTYAFHAKYLYDLRQEQKALGGKVPDVIPSFGVSTASAFWGDAACIIPWHMYTVCGDRSILEDQYESMKDWVDYVRRTDGENHAWREVFHFGDWLALDHPKGAGQNMGATDKGFIADVSYANSARIVSRAAQVLGRTEDAGAYGALAEALYTQIRQEYYSVTGRCCIQTQTALLMTLKYHLSEDVERIKKQLRRSFEDYHRKLTTGFVGTSLLGDVLCENGMSALAFELLLNEEYPGWLYEVKMGATTVWERWNNLRPDGSITGTQMNSMNHCAQGSVLAWIFRHVAGICETEDTAGSRHMELRPQLCLQLGRVCASYDSPAGLYTCGWMLSDEKHVTVRLSVPFGCTADVRLPMAPAAIYEDAQNPLFEDVRDQICHVGTGDYEVSYALSASLPKRGITDRPIGELLQDPEVKERLESRIPLHLIPEAYYDHSLRELTEEFSTGLEADDLRHIEELI